MANPFDVTDIRRRLQPSFCVEAAVIERGRLTEVRAFGAYEDAFSTYDPFFNITPRAH